MATTRRVRASQDTTKNGDTGKHFSHLACARCGELPLGVSLEATVCAAQTTLGSSLEARYAQQFFTVLSQAACPGSQDPPQLPHDRNPPVHINAAEASAAALLQRKFFKGVDAFTCEEVVEALAQVQHVSNASTAKESDA